MSSSCIYQLIYLSLIPLSLAELSVHFYNESCPRFGDLMLDAVLNKYTVSPIVAPGTIRLFLHDCLIRGCDASILVSSTAFNTAERDADINLSLSGDAFDLVIRAKAAVELSCPNTVSCADILAVVTRDLLFMTGGPHYKVLLGRRDGVVSNASEVRGKLPEPTMPMDRIISIFGSNGFSISEMVALSGAHTIGMSHCTEFAGTINSGSSVNPTYNHGFALGLLAACRGYEHNRTIAVFNDVVTPNKFDNMYFRNLGGGLGLLASDHFLHSDPRTRPFVVKYAANQTLFFHEFSMAMEKLSVLNVRTGLEGQIRRRCDQIN